MSAFVVSKDTIDAIVTVWIQLGYDSAARQTRREKADEVGRMLWAENDRSVGDLYSTPASDILYSFEAVPLPPVFSDCLVPFFKLLKCWEYQSCESRDFETTEAWLFVARLRTEATGALRGSKDCTVWDATDRSVLLRGRTS